MSSSRFSNSSQHPAHLAPGLDETDLPQPIVLPDDPPKAVRLIVREPDGCLADRALLGDDAAVVAPAAPAGLGIDDDEVLHGTTSLADPYDEVAHALPIGRHSEDAAPCGDIDGGPMRWKTLVADLDEAKERKQLRGRIQRLLDKWQPILGVKIDDWDLRKLKLYWGSSRRAGCDLFECRPGHITFNTELAKLPPRYLEYIVVHELVHHLTDGHDARFYKLMDRHLPGWRKMQARIEEPLERYS